MTDEKEYLTKEKFDALQDELNFLKTTRRKEIAENLEYARSLGDISENAEYHEARELQAAAEDRINKLELILKSAKIVAHKSNDFVNLGSEVEIQKDGETETRKYKIVGSEEANMQERKISHISPLGEALIGKKKGETFSFITPNGKLNCKIISIK
ncbi:transcription elongation factor GreA [Candidatus Campbellbacteria bacterium CG10_big_fil_rev_8_21_14_0_10_35_52]|uniref:Transcription elongation factor GreA n=1 Tax=Candidatus Campbellbacteria bacterium CG10_big_fil_rev_8_21_14_0_10_35_52 TaxID=1974527 RepID=A0A2M6WUY2_9BACT|nr:MAG: transcription elongation factor GreA [Candidatus Campbellbacteria bacterium CG10_big_fil_rev_8_21_14_0_10_35_52]